MIISISEYGRETFRTEVVTARLLVGRQDLDKQEPAPYGKVATVEESRLIIASWDANSISRKQLLVESLPTGGVRLKNVGQAAVHVPGYEELKSGEDRLVAFPVNVVIGTLAIGITEEEPEENYVAPLPASTPTYDSLSGVLSSNNSMATQLSGYLRGRDFDRHELLRCLQETMAAVQSAAWSSEFLPDALGAVLEIVGLNAAGYVQWTGEDWKSHTGRADSSLSAGNSPAFSTGLLEEMRRTCRTITFTPATHDGDFPSLTDIAAVVAAPVLDGEGQVIGALYGERRHPSGAGPEIQIEDIEALLVEIIAGGVSAGLARQRQAQNARKNRTLLNQFFGEHLVEQLLNDPTLLDGRNAEISALFCDIRGFSRISNRLNDPTRLVKWVQEVMNELSDCVLQEQGVLVDYIGDELVAMWGAPTYQPDHALLASRAGWAMLERLDTLNRKWKDELGEVFRVGVGINSGIACVGNTGSDRKFKYGPLGHHVNVASRIQGATKYFSANLLVTRTTADALASEFATRRIRTIRVVNIEEPLDVFDFARHDDVDFATLKYSYESALTAYEARNFDTAVEILGDLWTRYPHDGPVRLLLSDAVTAGLSPESFDSVFALGGK